MWRQRERDINREIKGQSEGQIKRTAMAGSRSVMRLGTELTLTIYLFACLAFENHRQKH